MLFYLVPFRLIPPHGDFLALLDIILTHKFS